MTAIETTKMLHRYRGWLGVLAFFSPLKRIQGQWFVMRPMWNRIGDQSYFSMSSINKFKDGR